MSRHRLSDTEIELRIAPRSRQWSADRKTIAWSKLREAVSDLHALASGLEDACAAAEFRNPELSGEGVRRQLAVLGKKALAELKELKAVSAAERAVKADLDFFSKQLTDMPKPPTGLFDIAQQQEIRSYIKNQKTPIDHVLKNLSDQRTLAAVLTQPPYLSGLSDAEWNVVNERAKLALHPVPMQQTRELSAAFSELLMGWPRPRGLCSAH